MSLKIWGVRGTIPAPATPGAVEKHVRELFNRFFDDDAKHRSDLDAFFLSLPQHVLGGFGGNTSCLEVKTPDGQLIVDAGSGIRPAHGYPDGLLPSGLFSGKYGGQSSVTDYPPEKIHLGIWRSGLGSFFRDG